MISLLCVTLVAIADPSAANLAGNFAEVQQAAPSEQPNQLEEHSTTEAHAGWSREQLVAERDRLEAARPSIAPPIVIVSVGGAMMIGAGYFALSYASMSWLLGTFIGGPGNGTFGVAPDAARSASIVALVGAAGVAVGLAYLAPTIARRRAIGPDLDRVSDELEARDLPRERPAPTVPLMPQASRPPLLGVSATVARF